MKILSLLFICLFITAGAFAQSSQSQDILNKLSSSMKSLETFYMEFNANIKNTSTGINESEKGKAIAENPNVCLSFHWVTAERQVIIKGSAQKIAKNLSDGYFESRPKGSQLGALASKQSRFETTISLR